MLNRRFGATILASALTAVWTSSALSADVDVPSPMDWSGFYFGGMVGAASSNSDADIKYGSSSGSGGWTESGGYFTGQIYDDINLSEVETVEYDFDRFGTIWGFPNPLDPKFTVGDTNTYDLSLGDALDKWLTSEKLDETNAALSGVIGAQHQFGAFVVGGELRASFGDFGNSQTSEWEESLADGASDTCNASAASLSPLKPPGYCEVSTVTPDFGASNNLWSATENSDEQSGGGDEFFNIIVPSEPVSIDGEYRQANSLAFSTEYNAMFTPAAKLGFAGDRFLVFGMGGPTMARVEASTSASVTETGEIRIESGVNLIDQVRDNVLEIAGSRTYNWQGTNTETMWGYTVGGGIEFAATDSVIFRIEGSYTDLGTISVTGRSPDTDATYKVKQDLTSYAASTGMMIKF